MKRNNIKCLVQIVLCAVMGLQVSCNKILDLDPLVEIADGNYWKSANDFKLFANDFYDWRRDFKHIIDDHPHSDFRSDIMKRQDPNVYSNGTNTIPATDEDNFNKAFVRIRAVNLLLERAASYSRPDEIAQYVGEARFLGPMCISICYSFTGMHRLLRRSWTCLILF